MLPVTHILAPIVLLRLYDRYRGGTTSYRDLIIAGGLGALPDLLNPHLTLAGRVSWSHSLLILVPLGLIVILSSDRFRYYSSLLLLGFSSHILLDIISAPYNFLYPLTFEFTLQIYPSCGDLSWFYCWYAMDLLFLTAFFILEFYRSR